MTETETADMHPLPHLPYQQPPPPPPPSSHHRYPRLDLHPLQPASLTPREDTRGLSAAQVSPTGSSPQNPTHRDPDGECGVAAGWWKETDRRLHASTRLTGGGCRAASTFHQRHHQPLPHCSSFLYTHPHPLSITKKECALARTHISSVEVAAQVWCSVVKAKHSLSTKEATALTEAMAIHYTLTVAANKKALNRRANKAIAQFLKDEELLKAVWQVSTSPTCALARTHISSVEVAAQVWCSVVKAKHSLSTKEATALTEAMAIHYTLTVAANKKALNRRANKAIAQFLKDEELLKAVWQVSTSPTCALARTHISSVEVAAQVWCSVVKAKHSLSTKEATALTEAMAIHYTLTVAANKKALNRRANKAIAQFLKDEELLKAVWQVSTSPTCARARTHISSVEVAAQVLCSVVKAKHWLSTKEATALTEAMAIHYTLTMAANKKALNRRANKAIAQFLKDEELLKAVCQVILGKVSLHRMILGGHLLHLMAEKKITSPVDTLKATLIQVYVKQVLQSKNKVSG
ncbi:hypothetical protein GWK47_050843 [Chionoecetes opilio]|uniref:Uncharacterized protein n=1 Tax=Chionoecetes opilio TaxID=41210 RepID=A0A8J5CD67_CHIOP|nr:hypothetical protein GWK47_050843 [Chionoecetes opilio]